MVDTAAVTQLPFVRNTSACLMKIFSACMKRWQDDCNSQIHSLGVCSCLRRVTRDMIHERSKCDGLAYPCFFLNPSMLLAQSFCTNQALFEHTVGLTMYTREGQEWIGVIMCRCPRPGCGQCVALDTQGDGPDSRACAAGRRRPVDVQCACGERFCLSCGMAAHEPAPCAAVSWRSPPPV